LEGVGVTIGPLPDPAFWAGKRVLLTGHTGFKGSWTTLWLAAMGAKVSGLALAPDTEPALFHLAGVERDLKSIIGDIRNAGAVQAAIHATDPQIVIHMAAQPLVRRSIVSPIETFATNVQGTVHVLDALRDRPALRAVLVVTSDKVYANEARGRPFAEGDPLGGKDPYSASKAAAELVTRAFAASYFDRSGIPVATARAGNIIGGGDFAPDRLVPDVIRAVRAGKRLLLRHPESTRPWQHVLDCVAGYLLFVEALATAAVPRALNFGPDPNAPVTVAGLAEAVLSALGQQPAWDHVPVTNSIEMRALALDGSQARMSLGWRDHLAGALGVAWTADWYRAFAAGADVRAATLAQITAYRKLKPDPE
jgi:CDP-glucose 4,6-dehydratase